MADIRPSLEVKQKWLKEVNKVGKYKEFASRHKAGQPGEDPPTVNYKKHGMLKNPRESS